MRKYYCISLMLFGVLYNSCSSTQRITVKQEQEGQKQETVIESDTRVKDFSMTITHDQITYNGAYKTTKHCRM